MGEGGGGGENAHSSRLSRHLDPVTCCCGAAYFEVYYLSKVFLFQCQNLCIFYCVVLDCIVLHGSADEEAQATTYFHQLPIRFIECQQLR
jgi:hypothetical protein